MLFLLCAVLLLCAVVAVAIMGPVISWGALQVAGSAIALVLIMTLAFRALHAVRWRQAMKRKRLMAKRYTGYHIVGLGSASSSRAMDGDRA